MVLAVLLAPILAVQIQKWLEHYRAKRERQLKIFKTLMASRATSLSPAHVEALNLIDLEFHGDKFKKIRKAWKTYLDHLGDVPKGKDAETMLPIWNEKNADLLAVLLMEMGKPLGYDFDVVHVKKGIYLPEGHTKLELEQDLLRKGAIKLLYGDSRIKMDITSFPVDNVAIDKQKKLTEELLKAFQEQEKGIPIIVRDDKKSSSSS